MKSATASRRSVRQVALLLATLGAGGCSSVTEIQVETPLQSKLDVSAFRRVIVAGFVTEPWSGTDIDVSSETARLLQNQLRAQSKMQVLEPDRPPINAALSALRESAERGGRSEREKFRLEADRILQDGEFWRKIGEEFQSPLIVTGLLSFEAQDRSGFESEDRVVNQPGTNYPGRVRGSRFTERKGFALSADFYFVDGRSGQLLHKERFTEEVLYREDQKISALSSYFELMDRLLPNFLGVIAPQKIKGTRVLLP